MKTLRWILLVLGVVVVAVAACEWAEWPFLRGPLEKRLHDTLGRDVRFGGDFGLRLFGRLRVHADRLDIADTDPGAPPMLHAEKVRLVLPWRTVIHKVEASRQGRTDVEALQVERLDVDRFALVLRRDAEGRANWRFGPLAASSPQGASSPLPRFDELVVRDGRVHIDDEVMQLHAEATVSTREGSEMAAAGGGAASSTASSGPPASAASAPVVAHAAPGASGAAGPSNPPAESADASPGLHVRAQGRFRDARVEGWLASTGVLPLVAAAGSGGPPAPVHLALDMGSTSLRVDGQGRDLLTLRDLDGDVHVTGPSLGATGDLLGLTLPTTPRYDLRGHVTREGDVWNANVTDARIGESRLHGRLRFDARGHPPLLTGDVASPHLLLSDLGPAVGGRGSDVPAKHEPGRLLPDRPFDIPRLKAMDADVRLAVSELDLGTSVLSRIEPLDTRIQLHDGVLALRDIVARAAEGRLTGEVVLDGNRAPPVVQARIQGSGIELGRFLTVADKHEKNGPGRYITGRLGLSLDAKGTGRSTAALLGSLDGAARLWVHGGTISHLAVEASGIDLAQAFGALVQGDQPLPLACVASRMKIEDGVFRPEFLIVDTHDTTITAHGGVSLNTERIDLDVQARPHDFSPLTLRTPVHVTGTFSQPHVTLEKGPLVKKGVVAAVLGAISPPAALLGLMDFGEKEDRDVCGQALARLNAPVGSPVPKAAKR